MSAIIFFVFLGQPSTQLDLFFFGKFYNNGECKPQNEIEKYAILGNKSEITKNEMVKLGLVVPNQQMVKFGLFYTRKNKAELQGVHLFFSQILGELSEEHRSYFPDLISCVANIPYWSWFGLRDEYGLLYQLSPTLEDYQREELSSNPYSFIDLVDIYLDVFKAAQIMIAKGFFMRELKSDGVGIVLENQAKNVHVRGKIRKLHELRFGSYCNPASFPEYKALVESFQQWNQLQGQPVSINLKDLNNCQVINLYTLWDSFVDHVAAYFRRERMGAFAFDNCLGDFVSRDACADELSVIWNDMTLRREMRSFRLASLRFTSESTARFLIYVLERLKTSFLQSKLADEEEAQDKTVSVRKEIQANVQEKEREMTELEKLEWEIMNSTPQRKKKVESITSEFQGSLRNYAAQNQNLKRADQIELNKVYNNPLRNASYVQRLQQELKAENDEDALKRFQTFEQQKSHVLELENQEKLRVQAVFDQKKAEIRNKFRSIVMRALMEQRKARKEMSSNEHEVKRLEKLKKSAEIDIQNIIDRREQPAKGQKSHSSDDSSLNRPLMGAKQSPKSKEQAKDDLSGESSSGISDYQEEDSLNSSEDLSVDYGQMGVPEAYARESLELEGLVVDFDADEPANQEIIQKYEQEVVATREELELADGVQSGHEKSECSEIVADRKQAENNTSLILKHELMGNLLNVASLKVEIREAQKLSEINDILEKKQELEDLIDQDKTESTSQIEGLKLEITVMVSNLVEKYGEAEVLSLNDDGITHYTIGDFKQDLSLDEFKYIFKKPSLDLMPDQQKMFI